MTYKVEMIKIKKSYKSVVVSANNRMEALAKARTLPEHEFDETENTDQVLWETKKQWNLLDFLFNRI